MAQDDGIPYEVGPDHMLSGEPFRNVFPRNRDEWTLSAVEYAAGVTQLPEPSEQLRSLALDDRGHVTGMVVCGPPDRDDGSFVAEYVPFSPTGSGWKARYDKDHRCIEVINDGTG